ncbi:unnamed protein product [Rhizopus stolonifer]
MSTRILSQVFFKQGVQHRVPLTSRFVTRQYSTVLKTVKYDDIQQLITNPKTRLLTIKDYVLLDVREPREVEAGHIPTAKNVPLKQFHFAWDLSEKDFEDNYGFEKPRRNERLITYCLKGVRSTMAANYLLKLGYNVESYEGSYDDYLEKSKGRSRS